MVHPTESFPLDVTAGRLLYSNGGEIKSPDQQLQLLKQKRILNRVLGSFDFTGGRSFDGVHVRAPFGDQTLTASYLRPTQGGFATDANAQIQDIQFATLAYTTALPVDHPNELQLFHYYFEDTRDVVKVDNRDVATRAADMKDIRLYNIGLSSIHSRRLENLTLDGLVWGIFQTGQWGEDVQRSGAFAVETGTRFDQLFGQPRLAGGHNWGSGDASRENGTHSTFYQMLPTARQYALLPFYNGMNN